MRMRTAVFVASLLGMLIGAFAGGGLVLAREGDGAAKVEAQDLFVKDFAGDPSKEVKAQLYTFPAGAILPWHIHPDADEIAYVVEGTFTFQRRRRAAEGDEARRGRLCRAECRPSRAESERRAGQAVRGAHQAEGQAARRGGAAAAMSSAYQRGDGARPSAKDPAAVASSAMHQLNRFVFASNVMARACALSVPMMPKTAKKAAPASTNGVA